MPTRAAIDDFLAQQRLALVGVSRKSGDFTAAVYNELRDAGYEVFPVNPAADMIEGDRCYPSVAELPDVDGAMVMVPADRSAEVVTACADRGIPRVWLLKGVGQGAVSDDAIQAARDRGLALVDGACPLMFLEPTSWVHRLHRAISGRRILVS